MSVVYYHVPRSQVWEGSRGRQQGKLHLHVDGKALCGKVPWYPRRPDPWEEIDRCPTCLKRAEKRGLEWPMGDTRPERDA